MSQWPNTRQRWLKPSLHGTPDGPCTALAVGRESPSYLGGTFTRDILGANWSHEIATFNLNCHQTPMAVSISGTMSMLNAIFRVLVAFLMHVVQIDDVGVNIEGDGDQHENENCREQHAKTEAGRHGNEH